MQNHRLIATTFAALVLGGCAGTPAASSSDGQDDRAARATLEARSGSQVQGEVNLMRMGSGVHFIGELSGLPANAELGFHVHETGDCSAADASSAGAHFNPTAQPHGGPDSAAHHAGDLGNIQTDAQGHARINAHVDGLGLGEGAANHIAGRALVVHAKADDFASQPAGNAGARIACGVIRVQ